MGNEYALDGCDAGNCLRSQVNLTETKQSLAMITKAGVPGRKVIVGVTSYGRSFEMAQPGCWGPSCTYTGTNTNSYAKPGVCTGTAGYIADAEIAEIMAGTGSKRSGRVTASFVDASSNSDILVYDDTQWVGYMSAATKKSRAALYTAWGMGGTTDWASDLQKYNDVPSPAKDWNSFKQAIRAGLDPKGDDGVRDGNWTKLTCDNDYTINWDDHTPEEIWKKLNADAAWDDVVRNWKDNNRDRPGFSFMDSVGLTLGMGAGGTVQCGTLGKHDNCDNTEDCPDSANGDKSGPAAQLIWNSLVWIHEAYHEYYDALYDVAGIISTSLDNMEDTFAPIPASPDNKWTYLLIDLITLGTLSVAGPFFNTLLKNTAYFIEKEGSALDNLKDTTLTLIGQSTTIAKDVLPSKDSPWTPEAQNEYSNYMGQAIAGWANVTSLSLEKFFEATDDTLDAMGELISDGKLIRGSTGNNVVDGSNQSNDLRANLAKSFYAYAIPNLWRSAKTYAFVLDSGISCSTSNPLGDYLEDDTMKDTGACVDGTWYYLVHPDGDSKKCQCQIVGDHGPCQTICRDNKFSAPPGIGSLSNFGGISKDDLITGSVRTYKQNGQKNGGSSPDPRDGGTIDNLLKVDVTTPGYVRLPVCSPERAFQSWDTSSKGSSDNYPCDIPPGKNDCGDSSFENQTSDASPSVDDCLAIIKNIQGDGGTEWTTQVVGKNQREIAKAGSCAFGVEATNVNGNVNFKVGGQDVIDIINEAINRFGGGGKVGAKGDMSCNGNVHGQDVKWGIY